MKTIWIAAAVTMLAACGPTGGNAPAGNEAASVDDRQRLEAMPEGQRNAVFIRAIRDARLECQHVQGSVPAGEYEGMPVWDVRCAGGGNWTIVVTSDGTAQILNANEARLVRDGNRQ
jgi:hypothetical protein